MRLDPEFLFPVVTQSGHLVSGSPLVTGLDTFGLVGALSVSGPGIPFETYVLSIDSPIQITLTQSATVTGAQDLTFRIEPISLTEAKKHLRLEIPDDDVLVADLIVSARMICETQTSKAMITQARTLYLDSFPSAGGYYNRAIREIWPSLGGMPSGLGFYPGLIPNSTGVIDIPWAPLQSLSYVKYIDFQNVLQTIPTGTYNVSLGFPARIQPAYSRVWPISQPRIDSVQIGFISGYGDTADKIPSPVKSAMKLIIASLYENKEEVTTVATYVVPNTVRRLLAVMDSGTYY